MLNRLFGTGMSDDATMPPPPAENTDMLEFLPSKEERDATPTDSVPGGRRRRTAAARGRWIFVEAAHGRWIFIARK